MRHHQAALQAIAEVEAFQVADLVAVELVHGEKSAIKIYEFWRIRNELCNNEDINFLIYNVFFHSLNCYPLSISNLLAPSS